MSARPLLRASSNPHLVRYDYTPKPGVSIRVTAPMLRRREAEIDGTLIRFRGNRHHSAKLQWQIFLVLLLNRGKCVEKLTIFDALYGEREDGGPFDQIIPVLISHLRKTIYPATISNVWGRGYTLDL